MILQNKQLTLTHFAEYVFLHSAVQIFYDYVTKILWTCHFWAQKLSNFVSLVWKLHNQYYSIVHEENVSLVHERKKLTTEATIETNIPQSSRSNEESDYEMLDANIEILKFKTVEFELVQNENNEIVDLEAREFDDSNEVQNVAPSFLRPNIQMIVENRLEAESKVKIETESKAKLEAEAKVKAEEQARLEAEAKVKAEEKARLEAEAKAELEEKARLQKEAESKAEAEENAKLEEQARLEAEANALASRFKCSYCKEDFSSNSDLSHHMLLPPCVYLQDETGPAGSLFGIVEDESVFTGYFE